jgi:hypothetical protein
MRWYVFLVVGSLFLVVGISMVVYAPSIPTYWTGSSTVISTSGVYSGFYTPHSFEVLIPCVPNNMHLRINGESDLNVSLISPNGTRVMMWQGSTINQDYEVTEPGYWEVGVSASRVTHFDYVIFATAPFFSHPVLIYASALILMGALLLLFSKNCRTRESLFKQPLFQQNIGGRWVLAAWIPILIFIGDAPSFMPRYPWLYTLLIVLTVLAVFASVSLAYVKFYVFPSGLFIEAPFLNFSKHYEASQIDGYGVTQEKKQRWLLLWRLPSIRPKKEPSVTVVLPESMPVWLQMLMLRSRFADNTVNFRPKSLQKLEESMEKSGIEKLEGERTNI